MEQIKWPTTSVWFDETLELFREIEESDTSESIAKKIKDGAIFGDKKEATARRVWGTINARYFGQSVEKALALKYVLNSNLSKQDKHCKELGRYICKGFDTYGPFKLVGGLQKGHPTDEEIQAAVDFYKAL